MKIKLFIFISFFFFIYPSYGALIYKKLTNEEFINEELISPFANRDIIDRKFNSRRIIETFNHRELTKTHLVASRGRAVNKASASRRPASLEGSFVEALRGEWTQSEESEALLELFTKRKWREALLQWDKSFADTPFNASPTGKALFAYLVFKNNIRVMAIDALFEVESPIEILSEMQSLWNKTASYRNKAWQFADVRWNNDWREIFDPETEVITLLHSAFSLKEIEAINRDYNLKDLRVLAQLEWNLILGLASQNFSVEALSRIQSLMKLKKHPVSRHLMYLTAGRILFQLRSSEQALSYYKLIPKSSDYWLTAQEEIAWTHIQTDEPQKALGYTHTLMHPVLANQVGPEPSYLHALASVKVCDYEEVLKTIEAFRINFEERIKSLLFVKRVGRTKSAVHLMQKFALNKKMPLSIFSLGVLARHLPYLINHDKFLFDISRKRRILVLESRRIRRLSSVISVHIRKELAAGHITDAESYSLDFLQSLREKIDEKLRKYNEDFDRRIKDLASKDIEHIHQIIKKLHIVKSEVYHFITERFSSKKVQEAYNKGEKLPQSALEVKMDLYREEPYQFVFADKAKELWFDELGNYRVHTNGCAEEAKNNKSNEM